MSVSNSSSVSLASLHASVTVSWLAVSSTVWVSDAVVSASVSPDVLVAISVAVSVAPSVSPSVSTVSSPISSPTVTLSISSSVSLTVPLSVSNSSSVSLASLHASVTVSWFSGSSVWDTDSVVSTPIFISTVTSAGTPTTYTSWVTSNTRDLIVTHCTKAVHVVPSWSKA